MSPTYVGLVLAARELPLTKEASQLSFSSNIELIHVPTMRHLTADMEKEAMFDWAKQRFNKAWNGVKEFGRGVGETWGNTTGYLGAKVRQLGSHVEEGWHNLWGEDKETQAEQANRQQLQHRADAHRKSLGLGVERAMSGAGTAAGSTALGVLHAINPVAWILSAKQDAGEKERDMEAIRKADENGVHRTSNPVSIYWEPPTYDDPEQYTNWRNTPDGRKADVVFPGFMQSRTVTIPN